MTNLKMTKMFNAEIGKDHTESSMISLVEELAECTVDVSRNVHNLSASSPWTIIRADLMDVRFILKNGILIKVKVKPYYDEEITRAKRQADAIIAKEKAKIEKKIKEEQEKLLKLEKKGR